MTTMPDGHISFVHHGPAQGWQCPVCQHVYSPSTPMCLKCPVTEITTTTTGCSCPQDTAGKPMHNPGCPFKGVY